MSKAKDPRRKKKRERDSSSPIIRLCIADGSGAPKWITADILDRSETGLGISLATPLTVGKSIQVSVRCQGDSKMASPRNARVAWCLEKMDGTFRAGLSIDATPEDDSAPKSHSFSRQTEQDSEEDFYEVLQISPAAEPETIHRVYKLLAQRYHPDNPETGAAEKFRLVLRAYHTLNDPELRASYDARRLTLLRRRWRIFGQNSDTSQFTSESERKKRFGILNLLYRKRMHEPDRAAMTLFDLEKLLGCPRDHLQFALWYLKEKGLIARTDRGAFSITVTGVDTVEERREPKPDTGRAHLAIAAPSASHSS